MKTLIKMVSSLYRIPSGYQLGRAGGIPAILTAASFCSAELRKEVFALADQKVILPTDFKNVLVIEKDFLGGIITELPVPNTDQKNFKVVWLEYGIREAFDRYPPSPIHIDWSRRLVSAGVSLLTAFMERRLMNKGYLSKAGWEPLPHPISSWLAPLRYILLVTPKDYFESVEECGMPGDVNSLLVLLRRKLPMQKAKQIRKDGIRRDVTRKRLSPDLIAKIQYLRQDDQRRVIQAVNLDDRETADALFDAPRMDDVLREIEACNFPYGENSVKKQATGGHREFYISFATGPRSLGHCDFEALCRGIIERHNTAPDVRSATLLVFIFLFCQIGLAGHLIIDPSETMIGRQLAAFPEEVPDTAVHQESQCIFWLPGPKILIAAVRMLQGVAAPEESMLNEYMVSMGAPPKTSIARLRKYLLFNGCERLGYGTILPRFGFYSDVSALDVARTYNRVGMDFYIGYVKWVGRYFPEFAGSCNLERIPASGSPRAAKISVVKEMYAAFMTICASTPPETVVEMLIRNNAAAGLSHLLGTILPARRSLRPGEM